MYRGHPPKGVRLYSEHSQPILKKSISVISHFANTSNNVLTPCEVILRISGAVVDGPEHIDEN